MMRSNFKLNLYEEIVINRGLKEEVILETITTFKFTKCVLWKKYYEAFLAEQLSK